MKDPFESSLEEVMRRDHRYDKTAYIFLRDTLHYTSKVLSKDQRSDPHLSACELCDGFLSFALSQFGPMAKSCVNSWGVKSTQDIGNIIFNMINAGAFNASEDDRLESFSEVFDFDVVFNTPFSKVRNLDIDLPKLDL
jgi:uncharacterized repeat protein (TIGR04138 family)